MLKRIVKKIGRILPDKIYISLVFFYHFHRFPNLKNPRTFNEKLQWLKLHDRKEEYVKWVDKIQAKEYIAETLGEEYVVPTLKIWDKAEDISLDDLPDQFVLKCNHDSQSCIICKDKTTFDLESAKKFLDKHLKENAFWYGREWPYKNVKPRVFAEKYLEDKETEELFDYKFFCFGGKPKYCQVISNRFTDERIDFYDMMWQRKEFTGLSLPGKPYQGADLLIPKPGSINEMIVAATKLSTNTSFMRVDFYEVDKRLYFGELTFYPASGFGIFEPDEWNYVLGDEIAIKL